MEDKQPTALRLDVLKRGLSSEEIDRLVGIYKTHRRAGGVVQDRSITLSKPLSENETKFLFEYLNSREAVKGLAEKYQIAEVSTGPSLAHHKLIRIAMRYLYQHREQLS